MGAFLTPLDTRAYCPGEFVLLAPLVFRTNHAVNCPAEPEKGFVRADGYRLIEVPRGFITDFASIPYILRASRTFDVNGPSRRPAVIHDYLYCAQLFDRALCDLIFYEALRDEGVSANLATLLYRGVRRGGARHYNFRQEGLRPGYDTVPDSYWLTA